MTTTAADRSTTIARLEAGPVEYRFEPGDGTTVLVFHGGHMRAGLALGERVFADAGHGLLVPSRPGYGRTPLSTATTPAGFADATRALCGHLGITSVAAVVGISAGGRTAVAMAAHHPDLVGRLILQSAVSGLPWPDRTTRLGARLVFGAAERGTWAAWRALLHRAPDLSLRLMVGQLTTRPARQVVAALDPADRAELLALLAGLRSGHGFGNDLRPAPDLSAAVTQPTLVIATRTDGSVPFAHAEHLTATIPDAQLVESHADSHFIWYSPDWPAIATRIRAFLPGEHPTAEQPASG